MICTVDDCDRRAVARTWCQMHWKRWKRNGDPAKLQDNPRASRKTADERFWPKVDKSDGENACWLWTAARDPLGYGFFRMYAGYPMWRAHRAAWTLVNGPIPSSALLCHVCDNPPCVNPKHLYIGTNQTNSTDKMLRDRGTKAQPAHRGERSANSKLTLEQVRQIRKRYAQGDILQRQLADEHGVSQSQIGRILAGKRWQYDH